MWSDSLGFVGERQMFQIFCTSRRSIFVVFQISLHLSAEMADLQNVDYLSMFFRTFVGEDCDGNIEDFVILINFPTSNVRILDLLCFEPVSCLFVASFFLASKLLRMSLAVSLLSLRKLRNFFVCLSQLRDWLLSAVLSSLRNVFACLSQFRYRVITCESLWRSRCR